MNPTNKTTQLAKVEYETAHLYGIRFSYENDALVKNVQLLGLDVPSNIIIASVPRLLLQDDLEDIERPVGAANFDTLRFPTGYLVLASAQFVRLIDEFSTVVSSTVPGATGPVFNITPADLIDGLVGIVTDRLLAETTPPTFGHNYVPEQLEENPLWLVLRSLTMMACWSFLIHHELAHIELGHVVEQRSTTETVPDSSQLQELATDAWASEYF